MRFSSIGAEEDLTTFIMAAYVRVYASVVRFGFNLNYL